MNNQLESKKQTLRSLLSQIPLSSSYDSARMAQEIFRLKKEIETEEMATQSFNFLRSDNKLNMKTPAHGLG